MIGNVSNNDGDGYEKRHLKSEFKKASNFIALIPSRSIRCSNVGIFVWS